MSGSDLIKTIEIYIYINFFDYLQQTTDRFYDIQLLLILFFYSFRLFTMFCAISSGCLDLLQ